MTESSIIAIVLKAAPWLFNAINSDNPEKRLIASEIARNRTRLMKLFKRKKNNPISWEELSRCVKEFEHVRTEKVCDEMGRFKHLAYRKTPPKDECADHGIAKRLANKRLPSILQTFVNNSILMKEDIKGASGSPSEIKGFTRRLQERQKEIAAILYIMKR